MLFFSNIVNLIFFFPDMYRNVASMKAIGHFVEQK